MNFWSELPRPFFILAPMEAVTDVVFRHVVAAAAKPDVFFTEFTNASSYASPKGIHSTRGRLAFTPDEQPMVAQIWGTKPDEFAIMARGLAEMGYKGIDINMGCPVKNVAKGGGGSGLIRTPELAAELIAAAKEGGLPVSVKTRLGYSSTTEWRDWLTHLLQQDVVNLTIHLRTRKEMSKVPAHHELIPEIKKLRDQIAPQTLLTINGDIEDRQQGMELVEKYGVDGIMIGRGIFHNPFAFEVTPAHGAATSSLREVGTDVLAGPTPSDTTQARVTRGGATPPESNGMSEGGVDRVAGPAFSKTSQARVTGGGTAPTKSNNVSEEGADRPAGPAGAQDNKPQPHSKEELLNLLHLHLDLFDKYSTELEPRNFEPLKRFFKIYVRDFPGASELRESLMHTKSTDEVRALVDTF